MNDIARLLELHRPDECWGGRKGLVVAIIGSGGKTTLLWALAQSFRREKILACTTVRMFSPGQRRYDHLLTLESLDLLDGPEFGITFAGKHIKEEGKIGAFSLEFLGHLFPRFDKSFIEADGSRTLPFKGWEDYEPVVPDSVRLTLAVMPVLPEGARVTEDFVHRIPLFCEISGAKPGQRILPEHLAALISHPKGPLKCAKGKVALFFNKAESPEDVQKARKVVSLLPRDCRERFWRFLAGSAMFNSGVVLDEE